MRPFKAVTLSDLHLGNPRTTAEEMVVGLRYLLPDNSKTAELDFIFFAGDVFDDLLHLNHPAVTHIDSYFVYVFALAKKYGIRVRFLDGTPRHEWRQIRRLIELNKNSGINADVEYFTAISIEYVEAFDLNILYVPDEARDTAALVYKDVQAVLKAKDLEKVDIAIMHGQFDFQLVEVAQDHVTHNSQAYLDLVHSLIFVGHVHTHRVFERIVGQGSTDRIAFGEPEAKGCVRWEVFEDGSHHYEFVPNIHAKIYATVECFNMDQNQILEHIEQKTSDLPTGAWVRLKAESSNPVFQKTEVVLRKYPAFTWRFDPVAPKKEGKDREIEEAPIYVPPSIDRENVVGLIIERMIKMGATPEMVARAREKLAGVI